jgi:hypothetical protein
LCVRFPARHRTEDAHIPRAVLGTKAQDVFTLLSESFVKRHTLAPPAAPHSRVGYDNPAVREGSPLADLIVCPAGRVELRQYLFAASICFRSEASLFNALPIIRHTQTPVGWR